MKSANFVALLAAILVICGLGISYINGNLQLIVDFMLAIVVLIYSSKCNIFLITPAKFRIALVLSLLLLWHGRDSNILGLISVFLRIFTITSLLGLSNDLIYIIKEKYLKLFAIVSSFSLFFWILFLFGIDIFPISDIKMQGVYNLKNHIAFIETPSLQFRRFQCLFLEPGQYGMLCVISLLLNKMKKDMYSAVYLLSALFSLSLSAYILLVILVLYKIILINKVKLTTILMSSCIFGGVIWGALTYNNGDNILNQAILFRLSMDEDSNFVFYNRSHKDFEDYYEKNVHGSTLWLGMGSEEYHAKEFEGNVDLKSYIALDGLVGLILIVTFYLSCIKYTGINKYSSLVLLTFCIIFYRGFVFSMSEGGLMLYYISMMVFGNKHIKNKMLGLAYKAVL